MDLSDGRVTIGELSIVDYAWRIGDSYDSRRKADIETFKVSKGKDFIL